MIDERHNTTVLGQRAVHRVISELLARGIVSCVPVVDVGFDLVTHTCVKIQVKSSRLITKDRWRTPVYWFNLTKRLSRGRRRRDGVLTYESYARSFTSECDFVILCGLDQDRFWIVPSEMIDRRQTVIVGPDSTKLSNHCDHGKLSQEVRGCENRWDLIEQFSRTVTEPKYDLIDQTMIEVTKKIDSEK